MNRRHFLSCALGAAGAARLTAAEPRFPLGLNTYCLRSLRWPDAKLLEYAASLKLDAIFLQDSLDPKAMEAGHWKTVRAQARDLGLHLETGGGSILPKAPEVFGDTVNTLRKHIERAAALGSPLVRSVIASQRSALAPGSVPQTIETVVKVLRAVRTQAMDAGLKIALETHKDLQAWEFKELVEAAGKEYVGVLLDTGNPLFAMEHPLTTIETLGPYALTFHLQDAVVYEHKRGIAVQCVPVGEGVNDFKAILSAVRDRCPKVAVYVKPITGRPPAVLAIHDEEYWKMYPRARAPEFARFLALAKAGHPYDGHVMVEDLSGRPYPEHFLAAIQYQQREHMERGLGFAQRVLDLGVRWRQ
ncbi:MAG TPA: sugar phosphate isomerase/epimerase [Solibacterales bacterium]|nr:sugar phosphate isomerase/epimerase [Bryobacterales bacterium]